MTFRVSADGIHWSKSLDGPIFHKNDGVAWRSARTYTPIVVHDAQGFGGHGPAALYKMWFSGRDAAGNYTVGFATLQAAAGWLRPPPAHGIILTLAVGRTSPVCRARRGPPRRDPSAKPFGTLSLSPWGEKGQGEGDFNAC
jgi:hypothetical protein